MNDRIKAFKLRIEEDPEFCNDLYTNVTIRLLAFKYAYYVLNEEIVKDITYDIEEKTWYVMGRALGLLQEDDITPCVDFNPEHPLAEQGIKLAKKFLKLD